MSRTKLTTPELLTVEETAEVLRCHPVTVWRAIRDGDLVKIKIRGKALVTRESLIAYITASVQD